MPNLSNEIEGDVVPGNKLGRKIGFPTFNLSYDGDFKGVYRGKVLIGNKYLPAAIHIGPRPAIGDHSTICEVHVVDWDGNGEQPVRLKVIVLDKIRDIQKFGSLEELKDQIRSDVDYVRNCESA